MEEQLKCVYRSTQHCDLDKMPLEVKQFEMMRAITGQLCKKFEPNMALWMYPEMASVMSLVAMATNPHVTKESLCP